MTRYLICRGGCGRITGRVSNAPPGSLRVTYGGYITGHEKGCPGREAPPPQLVGPDLIAQRRRVAFLIETAKAAGLAGERFDIQNGTVFRRTQPRLFDSREFLEKMKKEREMARDGATFEERRSLL